VEYAHFGRLAICHTGNRDHRTLHELDNFPDGQLSGLSRKKITALGAASGLNETCAPQLIENHLKKP
jgi:hypothetical protein